MRRLAGERKMISRWRSKSRPERRRLMLLLILAMICFLAGPALSAEPEHKYDGVYTGKRSLTKGTASTTCPAEDNVSVTITGETMKITINKHKYIMSFYPKPDGSFGQIPMSSGSGFVHYHGRILGNVMDGDTEKNPPCNY